MNQTVAASSVSPPEMPSSHLAPGVLILDDDFVQREWLLHILKRVGERTVFAAADGEEALDCLDANPGQIGLVICDLQLPGMDGMAFLRRVGDSGHRPGVIISSASDSGVMRSVELMAAAVGLTVHGSLAKPVNVSNMQSLLNQYRQAPAPVPRPRAISLTPADVARAFENHELVAFFQPKANMATGELAGVEALVRWIHPQHGILAPAMFLPRIESCGELSRLTEVVLTSAVKQVAAWQRMGRRIPVSVNLSLSALTNLKFCEEALALATRHGVLAQDVTFEILETAALTDVGRTLETMSRLRLNGFGLAIDDFGTGFSSFKQLSSIPFTELKIDRTFVTGVAQSPRQAAMVRSCIELAQRLNLKVVAEGVETESDWDFLAAAGATEAQGFLIAKPVPGEKIISAADGWRENRLH